MFSRVVSVFLLLISEHFRGVECFFVVVNNNIYLDKSALDGYTKDGNISGVIVNNNFYLSTGDISTNQGLNRIDVPSIDDPEESPKVTDPKKLPSAKKFEESPKPITAEPRTIFTESENLSSTRKFEETSAITTDALLPAVPTESYTQLAEVEQTSKQMESEEPSSSTVQVQLQAQEPSSSTVQVQQLPDHSPTMGMTAEHSTDSDEDFKPSPSPTEDDLEHMMVMTEGISSREGPTKGVLDHSSSSPITENATEVQGTEPGQFMVHDCSVVEHNTMQSDCLSYMFNNMHFDNTGWKKCSDFKHEKRYKSFKCQKLRIRCKKGNSKNKHCCASIHCHAFKRGMQL